MSISQAVKVRLTVAAWLTLSPTATAMGTVAPPSALRPGPTAITTASSPLFWAFSGIRRPPLVLVSAAALWGGRLEKHRLCEGKYRVFP